MIMSSASMEGLEISLSSPLPCADGVSRMPLAEFKRAGLVVRIWSEKLRREIWLVSNEQVTRETGIEGAYFTGEELHHLLRMIPSRTDLRRIADIKETVGGTIVDFFPSNGEHLDS